MKQQIATVKKAEFLFCRLFVAFLVWLAIVIASKELVLAVFVILLTSAILTVKRAPMIILWRYTFGRFIRSTDEVLNVKAMRFAHGLGSFLSGLCVIFLYFINPVIGWGLVWFLAIMKTISAFGFCPASKVYVCATSGGCCSLTGKKNAR